MIVNTAAIIFTILIGIVIFFKPVLQQVCTGEQHLWEENFQVNIRLK